MAKTPHVGQSIIHRDPHTGLTEKLVVQQLNPAPKGPYDFAFAAGWSLESANRVYVRPDDWIPAELDPSTPAAHVPGPLERHMAQRAVEGLAQKTHDALERVFGVVPNAPKREKIATGTPENPERENETTNMDDMFAVVRGLDEASNNIAFMRKLARRMSDKRSTTFMVRSRFVFLRYYRTTNGWDLTWGPYGAAQYGTYASPARLVSTLRDAIAVDIPAELRP